MPILPNAQTTGTPSKEMSSFYILLLYPLSTFLPSHNVFKMRRLKPSTSVDRLCVFCRILSIQSPPIAQSRDFSSTLTRANSSSPSPKPGLDQFGSFGKLDAPIVHNPQLVPKRDSQSFTHIRPEKKVDGPEGWDSLWSGAVQPSSNRHDTHPRQRQRNQPLLDGDADSRRYGAGQLRIQRKLIGWDVPRRDPATEPVPQDMRPLLLRNRPTRPGDDRPAYSQRPNYRERNNITPTVGDPFDRSPSRSGSSPQHQYSSRSVNLTDPMELLETVEKTPPVRNSESSARVINATQPIQSDPDIFSRAGSSIRMSDDQNDTEPRPFVFQTKLEKKVDEPVRSKYDRLMERIEGKNRGKKVGKGNDLYRSTSGRSYGRAREDEYDDDFDRADLLKKKALRKLQREEFYKAEEARRGPEHLRISLPPFISLGNLATLLRVRQSNLIQRIQKQRLMPSADYDQILNADDAGLIVLEYGFIPSTDKSAVDILPDSTPLDLTTLPPRPPVVTIMGHVDHGKTTILDFLRKSSIAANEHGGITQHIGAFIVPLSSGKAITFLDTPGHAAFLSMRQRGANVTDIIVLVVAADDSVMPQTIEAIKHAKAAKVPIIVAVNKIDRAEGNLERVKQDLAANDIDIEDYGGDTQVIPVSGKTGQGMQDLEESIITLSEILDHRAPSEGNVEGWIIEASVKNFGRAATVLIRRGTLRPGDIVVAGRAWGKVRTLRNEIGELITEAGPGTPVEVDGWRIPPSAGDEVLQATDEQQAAAVMKTRDNLADQLKIAEDIDSINASRKEQRELAENQDENEMQKSNRWRRQSDPNHRERVIEGTFIDKQKSDGVKEVFFVIKADVTGSVEAVVDLVSGLGNNEIRPKIIRSSAGPLNETDVDMAYSAGGLVLTFNTDVSANIRSLADELDVKIIEQSVIYRIAEDVNAKLSSFLPPKIIQRVTGEAEIANTFEYKAKGTKFMIAGCRVRNGVVNKGSKVRVLRGSEQIYDGK